MDYGETKPYSIRHMPVAFKDRLRSQAAHETEQSRAVGSGIKTMEALALELIDEGLTKREAERKG